MPYSEDHENREQKKRKYAAKFTEIGEGQKAELGANVGKGEGYNSGLKTPSNRPTGLQVGGNPMPEPYRAAAKGHVSSDKAKKILKDDSVKGHPLTKPQKRFFGWEAGGEK